MINRKINNHIAYFGAKEIAEALGGRKAGSNWSARCPAHEDRTPSLSLSDTSDGKVLVYCHAGCHQDKVIGQLKASGLWINNVPRLSNYAESKRHTRALEQDDEYIKRIEIAMSIWHGSKQAAGTLIETYLESRGLRLPPAPVLKFHPNLKHSQGGSWPTMIALVTRGEENLPIGIHRTFLSSNGKGKAPVDSQKMMLGPCRGGAVRLAEPKEVLMIGEGIETCLAAMQETGLPAWAALSANGLRLLDLPVLVREVIVLADGDDSGELAARDCAVRLNRNGHRVRIARPPKGMDFNDMLINRGSLINEARNELR